MAGELEGRTYLVTGANTGIGRVTALELARRGAHVVVACRSVERAAGVLAELRAVAGGAAAEPLALDLGSLDSVRECARSLLARGEPLHCLINNAGFAGARGITQDGFELAFGVNHLGPFLFTLLLLDRLKQSAPARIVNVSSDSHYGARDIDFDAVRGRTRSLTGYAEYAVSKLANVLFTAELARRLEGSGVVAHALHPGVVASDIWRSVPWPARPILRLFMLTPEQGARTTLHCATSDEAALSSGQYWYECHPKTPSRPARDPELARRLWERSAEWVGLAAAGERS
jgi:retinol dehydrogenase-12